MLLIAGGELDTNINVLVKRAKERDIDHRAILVGAEAEPAIHIDLDHGTFSLDGEEIAPKGCFIRQDVFLYPTAEMGRAQVRAQNWYCAVRGWFDACSDTRLFNRFATVRENNKIFNLMAARKSGLRVPPTVITNTLSAFVSDNRAMIEKPVAGGEYTSLLSDSVKAETRTGPRFVQPRLLRPEYRVYRIGATLMAFELRSDELDYRRTRDVTLMPVSVPADIAGPLVRLCDRLDLDFSAADFMLDEDGNLNFLEVNSQPMFAAFDKAVEGRLCDAILDELMGNAACSGDETVVPLQAAIA